MSKPQSEHFKSGLQHTAKPWLSLQLRSAVNHCWAGRKEEIWEKDNIARVLSECLILFSLWAGNGTQNIPKPHCNYHSCKTDNDNLNLWRTLSQDRLGAASWTNGLFREKRNAAARQLHSIWLRSLNPLHKQVSTSTSWRAAFQFIPATLISIGRDDSHCLIVW